MLSNSCSSERSTRLGITIWMRADTMMCKVLSGEVSILVRLGADRETHTQFHCARNQLSEEKKGRKEGWKEGGREGRNEGRKKKERERERRHKVKKLDGRLPSEEAEF